MKIILFRVRLMVDKVALIQISFSVLRVYSVGIILLMPYTHNLNRYSTLENCALQGQNAEQSGNFYRRFGITSVPFTRVTLKDGTHMLSPKRQ